MTGGASTSQLCRRTAGGSRRSHARCPLRPAIPREPCTQEARTHMSSRNLERERPHRPLAPHRRQTAETPTMDKADAGAPTEGGADVLSPEGWCHTAPGVRRVRRRRAQRRKGGEGLPGAGAGAGEQPLTGRVSFRGQGCTETRATALSPCERYGPGTLRHGAAGLRVGRHRRPGVAGKGSCL